MKKTFSFFSALLLCVLLFNACDKTTNPPALEFDYTRDETLVLPAIDPGQGSKDSTIETSAFNPKLDSVLTAKGVNVVDINKIESVIIKSVNLQIILPATETFDGISVSTASINKSPYTAADKLEFSFPASLFTSTSNTVEITSAAGNITPADKNILDFYKSSQVKFGYNYHVTKKKPAVTLKASVTVHVKLKT